MVRNKEEECRVLIGNEDGGGEIGEKVGSTVAWRGMFLDAVKHRMHIYRHSR
jgi:hypothetical protein